jgi:hypothetical protein
MASIEPTHENSAIPIVQSYSDLLSPSGSRYIVYNISCKIGEEEFTTRKRFSEFDSLYSEIMKSNENNKVHFKSYKFPEKNSSLSEDELKESRRSRFDDFMKV